MAIQNLRASVDHHSRHLKQDDAFNRTWWSVLSIDKLVTWQHLSIERIGGHVLLKASSCLRCLLSAGKLLPRVKIWKEMESLFPAQSNISFLWSTFSSASEHLFNQACQIARDCQLFSTSRETILHNPERLTQASIHMFTFTTVLD